MATDKKAGLQQWMRQNSIDALEVRYKGADGELDIVGFPGSYTASGTPLNVKPGPELRTDVMRAVEEATELAGNAGWMDSEEGGGGLCRFRADGSVELHHYERVVTEAETLFLIGVDGKAAQIERAPSLPTPQKLLAALADAITALRDLNNGHPEKELHKSVEEILEEGEALLRMEGWSTDDDAGGEPAPGQ